MDLTTLTRLALGGGGTKPNEAALRNFKLAFCIPGALPGIPYGGTEDPTGGRIWMPAYGCYDDLWRGRQREAVLKRGYTHWMYNWLGAPYGTDYPFLQPDVNRARRDLQELISAGLIPIVCLLDEVLRSDTSYLKPLADACGDLIWTGMMMWECDEVLGIDSLDSDGNWQGLVGSTGMACKTMLPNTLIFMHFRPGHGTGGSPEAEWTADFTNGNPQRGIPPGVFAGKLDQTDQFFDANATAQGLESTAVRLGGKVPPAPGEWAPCKTQTVRFEYQTTVLYHEGRTEQQGLDFSSQVIAGSPTCVGVGDSVR